MRYASIVVGDKRIPHNDYFISFATVAESKGHAAKVLPKITTYV